VKKR
jgi:hypothetical protein